MKKLRLIFSVLSFSVGAEELCKDYPKDKSVIYTWSEEGFTKEKTNETLAAIQEAVANGGSIGSCALPNLMKLMKGYILQQQAMKSVSVAGLDGGLKLYYVSDFCEFIRNNSVCE